MNLTQALVIVKEHIRVGKGMDMEGYGIPEALELLIEELVVTRKALELAIEMLPPLPPGEEGWEPYLLALAKEADHGQEA